MLTSHIELHTLIVASPFPRSQRPRKCAVGVTTDCAEWRAASGFATHNSRVSRRYVFGTGIANTEAWFPVDFLRLAQARSPRRKEFVFVMEMTSQPLARPGDTEQQNEALESSVRMQLAASRGELGRLSVRANAGTVRLSGSAESFYARQIALAVTKRITGVVQIVDQIEVPEHP